MFPYIVPHKQQSFERMLRYFGLTEFFHPASASDIRSLTFSKANIVQHKGDSRVIVTESDANKVKIVYNSSCLAHYCVACSTELDPSGDGVFWEVKLKHHVWYNWVFLGIAGNLDLREEIFTDSTSYGWTHNNNIVKGKPVAYGSSDGMSDFGQGESLYFSLKANRLKMHRIQKNKTFVIDDIGTNDTRKFYFHIGLVHNGTTVTLKPLDAQKRVVFD